MAAPYGKGGMGRVFDPPGFRRPES